MKKTRILVVDDDRDMVRGLEDNLALEGYEVITDDDGETGLAADAFSRTAALQPDDPEIQFNLARSLEGEGDFNGAATAYERAVKLQPGWPEAHFNLGKVYGELDRVDAAISQYEKFLEMWRGNPQFAEGARLRIQQLKGKSREEAGYK